MAHKTVSNHFTQITSDAVSLLYVKISLETKDIPDNHRNRPIRLSCFDW